MLGAGTAAAETLVKNLGQTTSAAVANLSNRDLSQAFTTGSTADAYELTEVKVQFGTVPGSTATVTAFIADGQGTSDDIIANLTNPPTWTTTSTFTAPDGITLDANTTYHLIIEGTEGTLATTASDSEDSGGVSGWSIADAQTQRSMVSDSGLGGTWTTAVNALKISVEGDHKGTVTACSAASMQNQVWTGTMTVGTASFAGFTFHGWNDTGNYAGANLSDENFSFDSEMYDIDSIHNGGGTSLGIAFDSGTAGDIATEGTRDKLVLHIGETSLNLGEGDFSAGRTISWLSYVPTWNQYDRVCLALTGVDETPPALVSAQVNLSTAVQIFYDEMLDSTSIPDKSAFAVKVEGNSRTAGSVTLSADATQITLTVDPAIRPGETVTVSYTVPPTNPIKDEARNEASGLTDQAATNNLPATAPEAPGNLAATPGTVADTMALTWETPWHNGDAITRFRVRYVQGTTAGGTWADILNSDADTTTHTVTGLTAGTQYTFEVRAVNGIDNGAPATVTQTTATPTWELTLTDNGNAVTQLTEGGASATATVRITNGVTFGTAQTVTLEWDGLALDAASAIQGAGGASEITIPPGTSSGTLVISAPDPGGVAAFTPPRTTPLWGRHGENQISGIDLTFSDDEDPPVATLEGDVTTGLLGADASRGRWLAGVAVSLSRGKGPFRLTSAMESNRLSGTVESSLTALYPYAKLGLSDRMEAWGLVGLGTGELTVRESGGTPIETDLGMTMGAVGTRGRLLSADEGGGLDLALRSDAMWVRMKSDAVSGGEGNLAAAQALVSRLRLIVEGSRTFAMADERTITPRGEIGVRHDLGDAETGTGLEVGAGVKFAGDGFSIEGAVRALVAHEDAHYREWGASGAIRVDPGAAGRGLSLSIAPTWGNAASAAARLWSARDAGGLVRADDFEAKSRLEAELGYGVGAPHGPGLVTPYAGLTLSDGARRALRTGVRWNAPQSATVSLEASREGQGSGEALTLRAEVRW